MKIWAFCLPNRAARSSARAGPWHPPPRSRCGRPGRRTPPRRCGPRPAPSGPSSPGTGARPAARSTARQARGRRPRSRPARDCRTAGSSPAAESVLHRVLLVEEHAQQQRERRPVETSSAFSSPVMWMAMRPSCLTPGAPDAGWDQRPAPRRQGAHARRARGRITQSSGGRLGRGDRRALPDTWPRRPPRGRARASALDVAEQACGPTSWNARSTGCSTPRRVRG